MYVNGNCIFFTDSTPVPRLPVLHTLFAGVPNLGRDEGREVLGSLGECPPVPRWAEGESDIFLGLSPGSRRGHLVGQLFGTRDWGGAKTDFQAGPSFTPFPCSLARLPALGHLLPARECKHPGQAIPALESPEKLRATRR